MSDILNGWKNIAKYLGVTERTIYNWQSMGVEIPVWKIGRTIIFFKSEINHWIKSLDKKTRKEMKFRAKKMKR